MNLDKYENMPAEVALPAFVKMCQANSVSFSIGFDNGNRRTPHGTKLLGVGGWMIKVGGEAYEHEDAEMTYPTLRHAIKVGFRLLQIHINPSNMLLPYDPQADPYEAVVMEHELRIFLNLCDWNKAAAILAVDFEKANTWRVKVTSKVTPFDDSDPEYLSMKEAVRVGIRQLISYANQKGFELQGKPPETHPILNRQLAR